MPEASALFGAQKGAELQQADSHAKEAKTENCKQQCDDCLKSSFSKSESGQKLNVVDAVEKLDFVKQSANDQDIAKRIDAVIQELESSPHAELTPDKVKDIVKNAFAAAIQHTQQDSLKLQNDPTQLNAAPNPFRIPNPFEARILKSDELKKSDNQDRQKDSQGEQESQDNSNSEKKDAKPDSKIPDKKKFIQKKKSFFSKIFEK